MEARGGSDDSTDRGDDRREGDEPNDAGGENSRSPKKPKNGASAGCDRGAWRRVAARMEVAFRWKTGDDVPTTVVGAVTAHSPVTGVNLIRALAGLTEREMGVENGDLK